MSRVKSKPSMPEQTASLILLKLLTINAAAASKFMDERVRIEITAIIREQLSKTLADISGV